MNLVDDINLVTTGVGSEEDLVLDLSDIVDTGVGSPVNLDHIEAVALGDLFTGGTLSTGLVRGSLVAIQGLAMIRAADVFPTPRGPENR